ncbi:hypothetical protein EON66_07535 [archaeon]|nr:MAG: hypothetical protein EON66_07535 [archaeon]
MCCCRQVTAEEAERTARDEGVLYIETSAKLGVNIKALFRMLASSLPASSATPAGGAGSGSTTTSNLIDIKLPAAPPPDAKAAEGCSC